MVNWDQPGSAKSFHARDIKQLTMEQYLEDAYALILQLRARFHQQKIYLVGHSWGSLLGIQLAHSHPHLFHAYIGIGQMVKTTENDVMGYTFALDQLSQKSDTRTLEMLKKQGPPPYYGKDLLQKYARYSIVLARHMKAKAPGHLGMTLDAYRSGEYGWIDKMNLPRGGISTFSHVYPQLAPVDVKTIARQFDIPITFIHGRWDVNQMGSLTAEYYADIQAAHKEMIWFEQSGHLPHYEESERFIDVMINQVLRETSE
jgi:pimeloyl-ACP methyl ester carboxylesterase